MKENSGRDNTVAHLEDRNLLGLIRGMAVCQGNAEIIRNLCAEYGIQASVIRGKGRDGGGHAWNQVQLDGIWYDDDFTDYQRFLAENQLEKCKAFLMGAADGIPMTTQNKYVAYGRVQPVGKHMPIKDKMTFINYGRVQQQEQQQSVQLHEKEMETEESIKDEVGNEFKTKTQSQEQDEQQAETIWMNRLQANNDNVAKMRDGAKKQQDVVKLIQDLDREHNQDRHQEIPE